MRELWHCPHCGRSFARTNQSHFCGSTTSLDAHFEGRDPRVRQLFDAFVDRMRRFGDFEIIAEKTRIAFHLRMSFAVLSPRKTYLVGHFVLARRVEHPRFTRIDTISPRNHVHSFRIDSEDDLDPLFVSCMEEAYAVGEQRHVILRRL